MEIRAGFEIAYECAQPTPMLLMLSLHPSRHADLLTPEFIHLEPVVRSFDYKDGFGKPLYPDHGAPRPARYPLEL